MPVKAPVLILLITFLSSSAIKTSISSSLKSDIFFCLILSSFSKFLIALSLTIFLYLSLIIFGYLLIFSSSKLLFYNYIIYQFKLSSSLFIDGYSSPFGLDRLIKYLLCNSSEYLSL